MYYHISQVVDVEADMYTDDGVMLEGVKDMVGAARSIVSSVTVVDAVIVPTETPEYVPLNRQEAEREQDFAPLLP